MKRILLGCLILFVVILLLTWCESNDRYKLSQPYETIERIEIVYVANDNILVKGFHESIETICIIEKEGWGAFFDKLHDITSARYWNDPTESVTGNVIRITYEDGAFELIGQDSVFYFTNKGWDYLPYYFEKEAFHRLVVEALPT